MSISGKLPYSLKQGFRYIYGVVPLSWRESREFKAAYDFLLKSQWWDKDRLETYQMHQLNKLLNHAYDNVPYYRRIFDERDLKPKDIKDFSDLKKLPHLSKEIIKKNYHDLTAKNILKKEFKLEKTSGSTAEPLTFYCEKKRTYALEKAFIEIQWSRIGYRPDYRQIKLTYELVQKRDRLWEYDPTRRILTLSPYHMNEENLHRYAAKIKKFKPEVIKAIPSALVILADFMKQNNIPPFPSIRAILLGSEMIYPWQRESIEGIFHARLYTHYGQAEKVVLAGECETNREYHIFPEYGVTELIGENGDQVNQEGIRGEIVGTGFNNYAMPFIRYRTGDIAVFSENKCECGRNYPLIEKIEGREQEFIVLKNGELIPLLALPFSSCLLNVKQFQFRQDTPGEITLKIVKSLNYTESNTKLILEKLGRVLGKTKIEIEFVSHIPKAKSGKYNYMIQEVPMKLRISSGQPNDDKRVIRRYH